MVAVAWSCALIGLRGEPVRVEVDIHNGLPHVAIVGLPDAAVRESKDRLYAALRNAGFTFPQMRITVNLAPADIRKAGPLYDLPIALAILRATEQLDVALDDAIAVGEVALTGDLRAVAGVLPIAAAARARGYRRIIVPSANIEEAGLVPGLTVVGADDLGQLHRRLRGIESCPQPDRHASGEAAAEYGHDLTDLRGQPLARRALEIAAAGGHNLLLYGPPGSGKTMLARSLPSILPPLTFHEQLEVTAVYSVAGALPTDVPLVRHRPFRSPHHTISAAGLVGGGAWPRPGEMSLAHHGVLFLDEMPEFSRSTLEVLRGPLEDRRVTIARAAGRATFPASFALVAARNPCPCGFLGDPDRACKCTAAEVLRYERRLSGPLLDRFDLQVEVPRVETRQLLAKAPAESSSSVRRRVAAARELQRERLGCRDDERPLHQFTPDHPGPPTCNGEIPARLVTRLCRTDADGRRLLRRALDGLGLSARAYHRVLKVARTIADLAADGPITAEHVAEALQYRQA